MKALALCNRSFAVVGRPSLQYFWLAVAGFLVHVPALSGQFLWDDGYLARDNPFIKSPLLALEAFRHHLFLGSGSPHYRPVQNLSYMLDYYFWNTDSVGFHLTNSLLHIAAGLLLFRLLKHLFQKEGRLWPADARLSVSPSLAAFFIAAIWIVHPVHSAAVDYISGRADSLAFVFAAGGWLLYLRANQNPEGWLRLLLNLFAACCGLLALCSREIACIWFLLFLIHTLVVARVVSRQRKLGTLLSCGVILGLYAVLRQLPGPGAPLIEASWPGYLRATLMLRALGDYARLLIWPANLHMERTILYTAEFQNHDHWRHAASIEYLSILGLIVAFAFVAGCVRRGSGQRLRMAGTVWFVAGYLPVSNIVQLNATVAEHWLYLPAVGALIFFLGCALELPARASRAIGVVAALALLAFGTRSMVRSNDWRDGETFFTRTAMNGGDSGRVMVNLALCLAARGEYSKAEQICRHILDINPDYSFAQVNLGFVLSSEGKKREAEIAFAQSSRQEAIDRGAASHRWVAARNYAQLRHNAGDNATATAALEKARAEFPDTWELISVESEILRQTKGPAAALEIVRDFSTKNWWHYAAHLAEGRLYAESGNVTRAEAALRFAALLDVHDVEALNLLAGIYSGQNQLEKAYAIQRRAIARQPDKPTEYLRLAKILDKMDREKESDAVLDKVSQMRAVAAAQQPLATAAN